MSKTNNNTRGRVVYYFPAESRDDRDDSDDKKSGKRKASIIGVICVLLAVVIAIAAGIGSSGFKNWQVKTWFNNWFGLVNTIEEEDKGTELLAVSDKGKAMRDGGTYAMPTAMAFVLSEEDRSASNTAGEFTGEKGVTLTATLSNKYIRGDYEWSFDFANPASTWAQGKNASDYLSLTVDETSTDKATIMALAPFGEPITVTATLAGSDKCGTCRVDYLHRVTYSGDKTYLIEGDFGESLGFESQMSFGIGTVYGEVGFYNAKVSLSGSFENEFKSYLKFNVTLVEYIIFTSATGSYSGGISGDVQFFTGDTLEYSMFINDFDSYSDEQKEAIYYAWWAASKNRSYNADIDMSVTYSYNGVLISNCSPDTEGTGLIAGAIGATVTPNVDLNGDKVL